jgi:hypothetical protein
MNLRNVAIGLFALIANLFTLNVCAIDVTRGDIDNWLAEKTVADPPVAGTVIGRAGLETLYPWIAPGYREEFEFDEIGVEIQATGDYPVHPSYASATEKFKGQASIGADGALENYVAGQPFSIEQIESADPATGGYMLAWDQIHRWQYYGYKVDELTMAYVGPNSSQAPLNPEHGLDGGGNLDRVLHQAYHRVYLNNLAMLPEQNYHIEVPDSDTRFFKDYIAFLAPFNIKGTRFVVERMRDPHADDQVNTYLPTERRVRRFSAQERSDSFMGSNGTLDDFEGFSGRVLDYKWNYLGQKKVMFIPDTKEDLQRTYGPYSRVPNDRWQVRNCYVVEVISTWDGHPYRSRVLFLDAQTLGVALSLVFNHDNDLWKVLLTSYRAPQLKAGDKQSLETSVLSWRGQINIDRLANTATVVQARTETVHPTMTKSKIKRIFDVSSLTAGQ